MSTPTHTPGPLTLDRMGSVKAGPMREYSRGSAQGQFAMFMSACVDAEEGIDVIVQENARRVVACWNAFDGRSTADIEAFGLGGAEVQAIEPSPALVQPETPIMRPMKTDDGRKGWYVDGRGFFLDIEKDKDGKWSAFFRDSATEREAFADQAESVQPQAGPVAAPGYVIFPEAPDGYVIVPNDRAAPTPDYAECARQADVATGLPTQYPGAWLSIFIREINRWCLHHGAAPVAQAELARVPPLANIDTAPSFLNTNDKAFWATGWNECRDAAMKGTP